MEHPMKRKSVAAGKRNRIAQRRRRMRIPRLQLLEQRIVLDGTALTDFQRDGLRDGLSGFEQWLSTPDQPSGLETVISFLRDPVTRGAPSLGSAVDLETMVQTQVTVLANDYFDSTSDPAETIDGLAASLGASILNRTDALAFEKSIEWSQEFNPALDFDGDGDVDGQDLGRFRRRLFGTLPE